MTTAPFTPPERWPFVGGEAVYFLSGHTWIRPAPYIGATVLACSTVRGVPMECSRASIQRADKQRTSSVGADSIVYRGYCEACELPAIEGTGGALICPRCNEAAVPLPPPDHLIVRWYPLNCYRNARVMRFQVQHPTWPWQQARDAADAVFDTAYAGMLARLKLPKLYHSSDYERPFAERQDDQRLFWTLDAAALLGDDGLFRSTHQELSVRQAERGRARALARRLLELSPERLATLLDLAEGDGPLLVDGETAPTQPPAVSFIPLPERPESDAEPDGEDETTRWLEQQFKKKRTT